MQILVGLKYCKFLEKQLLLGELSHWTEDKYIFIILQKVVINMEMYSKWCVCFDCDEMGIPWEYLIQCKQNKRMQVQL